MSALRTFISKSSNLLQLLVDEKLKISALFQPGFSLASYQVCRATRAYCGDLRLILDVGANEGQFALAAAKAFPNAIVYSFEPLPSVFRKLRHNVRQYPRIRVMNFALGNQSGDRKFYENSYTHASSALRISDIQKKLFPQTSDVVETVVPMRRLGDLSGELEVHSPALLKLDVQGLEREVIKGAGKLIRKVDFLLFETSFVQMYENEPLFETMHGFVKKLGFKLIGPVGFLRTDDLRLVQLDMLYGKESHGGIAD